MQTEEQKTGEAWERGYPDGSAHPQCNRMAQVQQVHIGDNVKYYPIIATDKQVAFKYFTILKKDIVGKSMVQKP